MKENQALVWIILLVAFSGILELQTLRPINTLISFKTKLGRSKLTGFKAIHETYEPKDLHASGLACLAVDHKREV